MAKPDQMGHKGSARAYQKGGRMLIVPGAWTGGLSPATPVNAIPSSTATACRHICLQGRKRAVNPAPWRSMYGFILPDQSGILLVCYTGKTPGHPRLLQHIELPPARRTAPTGAVRLRLRPLNRHARGTPPSHRHIHHRPEQEEEQDGEEAALHSIIIAF